MRDQGYTVLDADILAREVTQPGSFGLEALVQVFGKDILKNNVELDRGLLARRIFDDEKSRRVVERITHPLIQWRAAQEIKRHGDQGEQIIFYDAALIFEKGLQGKFFKILVVHCPAETQIRRLVERDKISPEQAQKRLLAQMPIVEKIPLADYLVDNGGSLADTKKQVATVIEAIKNSM